MVQTAVLRTSAPQCLRQEAQAPERSERCDGEVDALSETNGRIKNPGVVFEVTSEGTRSFVQKEKLRLRFEEAPTDLG